jgi:hypothetical protein
MQAYGMVDWRRIRQVQAITAFQNALALEPGLILAHDALAAIYEEMNHPDLALHHLRQRQQLAPPPPAALADDAGQQAQAEALEKRIEQLEQIVGQREKTYQLASANQRAHDRAFIAARLGLAQMALDQLLSTEVLALGPQATQLQLELMLSTGQAGKVRDWLTSDLESVLGSGPYRLIRLEAAAAWGDYEEAEEDLVVLRGLQEQPFSLQGYDLPPRTAMAVILGKSLLVESGKHTSLASFLAAGLNEALAGELLPALARQIDESRRKQADIDVVRALLAVEKGDVGAAGSRVADALALGNSRPASGRRGRLDFSRRPVAEEVQAWISDSISRRRGGSGVEQERSR